MAYIIPTIPNVTSSKEKENENEKISLPTPLREDVGLIYEQITPCKTISQIRASTLAPLAENFRNILKEALVYNKTRRYLYSVSIYSSSHLFD